MKFIALLVAALASAASTPTLSQADFQDLLDRAVQASVERAPKASTTCVQQDLIAPLTLSRGAQAALHTSGIPGMPMQPMPPATVSAQVDAAYATALRLGVAGSVRTLRHLPGNYVLYSSGSAIPSRCAVGGFANDTHAVRVRVGRPVTADGFTFIETEVSCSGLCGSGWVLVFKKQNGQWNQIESRNLFIS